MLLWLYLLILLEGSVHELCVARRCDYIRQENWGIMPAKPQLDNYVRNAKLYKYVRNDMFIHAHRHTAQKTPMLLHMQTD